MTTDLYSTVLFQDGEQITFGDLNNVQRFVQAQMTDQIVESLVPGILTTIANTDLNGTDFGSLNGANIPKIYAHAVSPGWAFLRQGSANNKIQISPGTLLQKIGNADGQASTFLPFRFAGTEEFTLTNGDATNPRVDLLQMALSYITDTLASVDFQDAVTRADTTVANTATRRRVQCILSVKTGTPGASPVVPDPDAGNVVVGAVVVGNSWTTAGNAPIFGVDTAAASNAVVHDHRMPLGVGAYRVDPVLYKLETAFALANTNQLVTSSSATNFFLTMCPFHPGRLLAVDIHVNAGPAAGSVTIGNGVTRFSAAPSTGYSKGNTLNGSAQSTRFRSLRTDFEAAHNPAAGPTVQASAVNKIGVPMWTSGYRTPQLGPSSVSASRLALAVQNAANAFSFGETDFFVAGGI